MLDQGDTFCPDNSPVGLRCTGLAQRPRLPAPASAPSLYPRHVARLPRGREQGGGRRWEAAEPTYRYGYLAGRSPQHQGRRFEDVEADLRTDYQRRVGTTDDPSGWERLRAEIREGWDRARG